VLLTSHVVAPNSAVTFCLKYGFRLTGHVQDGEPVLEFDLYPS
jgi:hypothetical protein